MKLAPIALALAATLALAGCAPTDYRAEAADYLTEQLEAMGMDMTTPASQELIDTLSADVADACTGTAEADTFAAQFSDGTLADLFLAAVDTVC
ncbi:hypothetical protein [Microbacterium schleiferi]|uniref:DUF732 domain-containing protein n=1 Tax=Microbacterium schleiferi TaxID=69362 RepID=A0ABU7VA00_9MICO